MKKLILVTPATKALKRQQAIVMAHGDKLTEQDTKPYVSSFWMIMSTKMIEVTTRINADPDNVAKLPKSLACDVYLLGSYMYYQNDESPLEDAVFDKLAAHLLEIGYNAPITENDLRAGTFIGKYPDFIIRLAQEFEE